MVQLMPLHPQTPSFLASFKSRLVSPFWYRLTQVFLEKKLLNGCSGPSSSSNNTLGDSDVIAVPAGFRRHLVGKTPRKVFHCDIAKIRFVGKLVIMQTFS